MHVYMYVHQYLCMCVYAYVDVYVHVYVYVFVVCVCVYVYGLPQWFHVSLIYIYIILYVIMNRRGSHNIRNGIVWVQTGHGTFT